jgi:uncharacterized protein (TIGR03435 family)
VPLKQVIGNAYGLSDPLIAGPDWLDKAYFDIAGKAPEGVPDTEIKPMLQSLLQERFHLAIHQETRYTSAYDLVIANRAQAQALARARKRCAAASSRIPPDEGLNAYFSAGELVIPVYRKAGARQNRPHRPL